MKSFLLTATARAAFVAVLLNRAFAAEIPVPNASFELPVTGFVNINIESWQKSLKPDWYIETPSTSFYWNQLTGAFKNTVPGSSDHIDNCHGAQAAWLFAVPEVALFQDYDSIGGTNTAPTHEFDARFEAGRAYRLTVGVIGGGGGMKPGVSMEIALYYRDASSNQVVVAASAITNSLSTFPTTTHVVDFHTDLPTVTAADAWAGQHIGVRLLSTVSTNLEGGYWDIDNVRLESFLAPRLENPARINGEFQFTLLSEPGHVCEILASPNLHEPLSNWTVLETVTNDTGSMVIADDSVGIEERFYSARQSP